MVSRANGQLPSEYSTCKTVRRLPTKMWSAVSPTSTCTRAPTDVLVGPSVSSSSQHPLTLTNRAISRSQYLGFALWQSDFCALPQGKFEMLRSTICSIREGWWIGGHRRCSEERPRFLSDHIKPPCGSEAGLYVRRIDACITQLKARRPARTCTGVPRS